MSKTSQLKPTNGSDDCPSEEESAGEMIWPQPDFDKKRVAALLKNPHFSRKKRIHSSSFSHSGTTGNVDGLPSDVRALTAAFHRSHISSTRTLYGKNSKKSRDGRRIPNKRGGKMLEDPTDVLDEIVLDHDDPDYDSDAEDPVTLETLAIQPSDDEFERNFTSLMNEFFIHGKTQEVLEALKELNLAPHQRRRLPYLAVTMALQHKQTQCELTSELLSDLCGKVINQAHIQQGFALILNELGELTIDFPKAAERVGRFIARAMMDDILPPKFIEFQKSVLSQSPLTQSNADSKNGPPEFLGSSPPNSAPPVGVQSSSSKEANGDSSDVRARPSSRNLSDGGNGNGNLPTEQVFGTSVSSGIGSASSLTTPSLTRPEIVMAALVGAEDALTLSRAFARLDNIWGVPCGPKAIKSLAKKIHELLRVYLDSKDVDEVTDSLSELDCPHFHHELVFQAIVIAIELSTDEARTSMVRLLDELCRSVVITPDQLVLGVRRVFSELPDLQLDVPAAYVLTDRFLKEAHAAGFVTKELLSEVPIKARKRFISETDSIYRSGHKTLPL